MFSTFHFALRPHGHLFLGPSEATGEMSCQTECSIDQVECDTTECDSAAKSCDTAKECETVSECDKTKTEPAPQD